MAICIFLKPITYYLAPIPMPELPEVQTVVNDLQKIAGDSLTGFWTDWERAIAPFSLDSLEKKIKGKKIIAVRRLSKFIVLDLSSKESLLLHLRMTGKLIINDQRSMINDQKNASKHLHHKFFLKNSGVLEFHDIRKFGTIKLMPTSEVVLENFNLGADPLSHNFTASALSSLLNRHGNKPIKNLLLDQALIAGIGNIYASEILFDASILPQRKASSLSLPEITRLCISIKKILKKAIKMRGTSVSDYRDVNGKKGSFQKVLNVYKRHGQKCKKCGTIVEKSVMSGRSTFYCPTCQQ